MAGELSVFSQIISNEKVCLEVLKREIGMKSNCIPFAVKVIEALKSLGVKTQQDTLNAANVLLSGLQTLMQGGIVAEDYDKIDLVKRGKTIVASARVEAFFRAAARKGYRIIDTIVAVPKEDYETTYFKENFAGGDIIYTLEDKRINPDRAITAERLIKRYFSKFICRLDVHSVKDNKRVAMSVCEMSIEDLLQVARVSEQGLYKSRWETYINEHSQEKKRKVITDELNSGTFWITWTGEMVNKTIIRRALKRIKEVLPELSDTIYAFDQDEYVDPPAEDKEPVIVPDVPVTADNVDLNHLTPEQIAECDELFELYCKNPKLAEDKLAEIQSMIDGGISTVEIINREYAALSVLRRSKSKWEKIGGFFE